MEIFFSFLKPLLVLFCFIAALYVNFFIFEKLKVTPSRQRASLWRGVITAFIGLLGVVIFVFVLPVSNELKGQIFTLFGIILSAGIALSSTTILGNLLAGVMNNSTQRFKIGDLIEVKNLQGRVSKKSFFYTEIQLEDSNFITIPNLYLATNPIKNTRKSDTVIFTTLSLGYDVPRKIIEEALKEAALKASLKNPYIYVVELGDFSIVYKVHGFLEDSDNYFSIKSRLNKKVLDALHVRDIEIVSPAFMNQRQVDDKEFIALNVQSKKEEDLAHEDQVFDKARSFERIEKSKKRLEEELEKAKDKTRKSNLKEKIDKLEEAKERVEDKINNENEK